MIVRLYERLTGKCWHKWVLENAHWERYYCEKCGEIIKGR